MTLSEFEVKRCEREIGRFFDIKRPQVHLRGQLDLGYRIDGQSVELFEIRPNWRNPETKMELPFAKATYVKKQCLWKIFWQRQDLKWHSYAPAPRVQHFKEFLAIVSEDKHGCFFG